VCAVLCCERVEPHQVCRHRLLRHWIRTGARRDNWCATARSIRLDLNCVTLKVRTESVLVARCGDLVRSILQSADLPNLGSVSRGRSESIVREFGGTLRSCAGVQRLDPDSCRTAEIAERVLL
jgi:hypothetical protein